MYIKRLILLFSLGVFAALNSFSQDYTTSNKKAIKLFEEGMDSYNLLYYEAAIESFNQALEKDPNFIEAYILLSQSYAENKDVKNAIVALEKSVKIDPKFYPNAFYFLGEMNLSIGDYEKAEINFTELLNSNSTDQELIGRSNLGVQSCRFAKRAMQNPVDFDPVNLGPEINTANPEYFPCLTADNETILFTRLINDSDAFGGKQEDFYTSSKKDDLWATAQNITEVNTTLNEGAPTLAPDGQILIFTACEFDGSYGQGRNGMGSCDLFYSSKVGSKWSAPENLGEKVNSYYWESQPSFSADGRTLYFVRGKYTKNGIAQQDIFSSKLNENGQWEKASKIKGLVNTDYEEESVMIHPDGRTLYFSSNGHAGMGGMDIFVSKLQDNGDWGAPVNLGYPINTFNNENSILVSSDGEVAYFASNRDGGYGDLDIYSFRLPNHAKADQVTYMKGLVIDANSFKKLGAKFELIDLESGEKVIENYSNPRSGDFLVCIPANRDYALNVSKEGYLFYSENFSLKGYSSTDPYYKEIELSKLRPGASIVLKNVFFKSNDFLLDTRSNIELDKLVFMLNNNPSVNCEISGHTDDVGGESENLILSDKRAKSVLDYLVKSGIDPSRLISKGYGEKMPIASNDSEKGRAQNRRTEFKILE